MPSPPSWAATVTRVNTNSWKASFGNAVYAGTFSSLREAEATIERSISPGAAPLPWRLQREREDVVEVWYVLQNDDGSFPSSTERLAPAPAPAPLARSAPSRRGRAAPAPPPATGNPSLRPAVPTLGSWRLKSE